MIIPRIKSYVYLLLFLVVCASFGVFAHGDDDSVVVESAPSALPGQMSGVDNQRLNASIANATTHQHSHGHDHGMAMPEPEYWWADDLPSYNTYEPHSAMLGLHIASMVISFGVLLPVIVMFHIAKSSLLIPTYLAFNAMAIAGTFFGFVYNVSTPDLYENNAHHKMGWILLICVGALSFFEYGRGLKNWWRPSQSLRYQAVSEEHHRLFDEPLTPSALHSSRGSSESQEAMYKQSEENTLRDSEMYKQSEENPRRDDEMYALDLDQDEDEKFIQTRHLSHPTPKWSIQRFVPNRFVNLVSNIYSIMLRSMIVFSFITLFTGYVTYTGTCRDSRINGCAAHSIKGGIFFWYGIMTFARYLGAFADLGWAWNTRPLYPAGNWRNNTPSVEFLESFVIFFYGITNTWMERFGKEGGLFGKWGHADWEHASIAFMFWWCGLVGMLIESKRVRNWLTSSFRAAFGEPQETPTMSHRASFNPFPALVIALTGVSMGNHHQSTEFSTGIHALWGLLLFLFGVFRLLTYLFLYIKPEKQVRPHANRQDSDETALSVVGVSAQNMPSRPPTEALAAFCLISGGIMFIWSMEDVINWSARAELADKMVYLNADVSLSAFVMVYVTALLALKGWATARQSRIDNKGKTVVV